jgi:cellulose biosynthesis protein BcsQ
LRRTLLCRPKRPASRSCSSISMRNRARRCGALCAAAKGRPEKLAEIIESASKLGMAMIIIDTPSKNDAVILAAVRAADMIICPVMVDLFSLAALQDTARVIDLAGKLPASVAVLNDLDETGVVANIGEAEAVLKAVGMPVAPVQIYHRPAYTAAIAKGLSVTELGAKQKAAADEISGLWTFLDAGALQPKPRKPKAKKPGKKGTKP